jgi:hypothetical protein
VQILNNRGEIIEEITSYSVKQPTLEDCMNAYARKGMKDQVRLQFAILSEALITINGNKIDKAWKNNFGMTLFEKIRDVKNDIGNVTEQLNQYGINPYLKRCCKKCGKEWEAFINTSSFFASGLR